TTDVAWEADDPPRIAPTSTSKTNTSRRLLTRGLYDCAAPTRNGRSSRRSLPARLGLPHLAEQVRLQPVGRRAHRRDLVLALREAVPFVLEDDVLDGACERSFSTSWSDSPLTTRGSFAPWITSRGAFSFSMYVSGDRSRRRSASSSGSPTNFLIMRFHVGGTACANVIRFDGPKMSTAAAQESGSLVTHVSTANPPYEPPQTPIRP